MHCDLCAFNGSSHVCWIQVTTFIREESVRDMQIIVISLKEEFFSKSDALLGVYTGVSDLALLLRPGLSRLFSSGYE